MVYRELYLIVWLMVRPSNVLNPYNINMY